MKLLINTTTILSLALYIVPPFAAQAQDLQTVTVGDQSVICLPNKQTACPDGAFCVVAKNPKNCQSNAEKAVASAAAKAAGATDQTATDQAAADKAAADKAAADQAAADQAAADKAAKEQAAADKAAADKAAADQAAADKAAKEQAAADKAAADKAAKEQAAADKAAADKAAADKAAADQAAADQAAADKAAADKAAADQAAADKAAADKAAADQTATDQAAADKAAADKAAADQAAADKAAADQAAADQAAADKAAADKAASDKTTATASTDATAAPFKTVTTASGKEVICLPDKAAVCPDGALCVVAAKLPKCTALAEKKVAALDKAAADKAAKDKTATDKAATDQAATDQAAADKAAADKAAADKAATDQAATDQAAADKAAADKAAADKAAAEQAAMDEANIAAAKKAEQEAAAKAAADPNLKPVEAPVVDQEATQTLETVLATPAPGADGTTQAPPPEVAAAAADSTDLTVAPKDQPAAPPSKDVTVTTETVTDANTRSSAQDFAAAPVQVAPGKKSGLSDLEKVGLLALGALVIGTMINNNQQQVVSNTGDRVVVKQQDGSYQVYKDDNSLLRQPGSKVTTETFKDGSTRSIVTRQDGSQIATVRDASGRVLQRVAYDTRGKPTVLIDDLQPERKIDVTTLPAPRPERNRITVDGGDAAMRAALASADAQDLGQKFSLRQIRTIKQVRYLAPTIDVNNITFATGSAAIDPSEARKLNKLGTFITDLIDQNPGEVFLIEGHTDAVGSAASNLALSDRRAESVAKALTEYFEVPPENMVVQGYGETELAVDTQGDELANRRVAVRIITPLLQQAAN